MDFVINIREQPPDGLRAACPGNPPAIHWHIAEPVVDGEPNPAERFMAKVFLELETRIKLFVLVNQKALMSPITNEA
jgi:hypothetical protein